MRLSGLHIYPVKSLGGIEVMASVVETRGLRHDRRFMLADHNGVFISQRECPQMALLKTAFGENGIDVFYGSKGEGQSMVLPYSVQVGASARVRIWNDNVTAMIVGQIFDDFFSELLHRKCSLVYMPDEGHRPLEYTDQSSGGELSFADAFPFLLIGTSSLDDLNARLREPVSMDRFRPNLVVKTDSPFEEDGWKLIRIGEMEFEVVKPCSRCTITTIDQSNPVKSVEPLRTLAGYRTVDNAVLFGQNLIVRRGHGGTIRVGDEVEQIE